MSTYLNKFQLITMAEQYHEAKESEREGITRLAVGNKVVRLLDFPARMS